MKIKSINFKTLVSRENATGSLIRDGIGSLLLKAGFILLTFGSTVLLARALGARDYGIYSYVFAVISLLAIPAQFGLPTLVVRETAQAFARQEFGYIRGIWLWSAGFVIVLTLVMIMLAALGVNFWKPGISIEYVNPFYWGLALILLVALSNLRGAALRGLHHMVSGLLPEQILMPGFFVLILAGVVFIFKTTITPATAMIIQVIAAALTFAVGAILLWQATPAGVQDANPLYESRRWLASTLPLAFVDGMNVLNSQIGIIILGAIASPTDVGLFRVATQISALTSVALVAINLVVAPQFAKIYANGDMPHLQKLATSSARLVLSITLPIAVFFLALGRPIINIFFGSEYVLAFYPLVILIIGQLVNSITGSVGFLLIMSGHERDTAIGMAVSVVINMVLLMILVPVWGIKGAAVASALSLAAWNVLLWFAVRRRLKINSMAFGFSRSDRK